MKTTLVNQVPIKAAAVNLETLRKIRVARRADQILAAPAALGVPGGAAESNSHHL